MKIKQTNKLKMAQATLGCLQDNSTVWTGIKGIEEANESLTEVVARILNCSLKQSSRTGFAALKAAARGTMLDCTFTVCSGLRALASATDDKKLFAQANFCRSDFVRGREADVVNRCQSLLALGNENAEALAAKYNVGANDLKVFRKAINDFTAVQSKPRQGRAASASATAELGELFAQLDKVLTEQLDPLVEMFQTDNPAFYNEYMTARTVVASTASHEPVNGNGAPVSQPTPTPEPVAV